MTVASAPTSDSVDGVPSAATTTSRKSNSSPQRTWVAGQGVDVSAAHARRGRNGARTRRKAALRGCARDPRPRRASARRGPRGPVAYGSGSSSHVRELAFTDGVPLGDSSARRSWVGTGSWPEACAASASLDRRRRGLNRCAARSDWRARARAGRQFQTGVRRERTERSVRQPPGEPTTAPRGAGSVGGCSGGGASLARMWRSTAIATRAVNPITPAAT